MTAFQRTLIGLLFIVLLFTITLVRTELFAISATGVWLFKCLVTGQFLLLTVLIGRLAKQPWWFFAGLFILLELGVWAFAYRLAEGQHQHRRGRRFVQEVVDGWDKNLIQYDPELSQYDPALFYTLKPNLQNVVYKSGFEINTPIRTNALGVRDDAASLTNPTIIILGDSFTMGWGVADSICYASRLEQQLGRKVLNAGISSFGTARESMLLKRIQRDSCRVLVVQYCVNDQPENEELALQTFKPSPRERYDAAVRYNTLTADYYPFKYLYAVLRARMQRMTIKTAGLPGPTGRQIARTRRSLSPEESFFYAIRRIRQDYKGPIIITCLNPNGTGPETIQAFQSYLINDPLPGVYLADVSGVLTPTDYFMLDNHINSSGHRKVARQLAEVIRANRLL
ncbi:SGNH/GDSL hydrolase family protein [Spirosoma taeanense]|uniref:SGNH/GDSL hydrolase family protein n=1 Tax=Spirosoma taeanense TaxID=2735870 RepID=A0A6M5Y852_9BACT|nr:SGNH/GDSL hydrolase family protein [Spirosoma taeanense]QJW90508.1 SGNH/GDSL hydrolase family protein [Spirosoma taeanense]